MHKNFQFARFFTKILLALRRNALSCVHLDLGVIRQDYVRAVRAVIFAKEIGFSICRM
jgi:tRNA nucleotidyltransferase/poly(A) polymerase